MENFTISLAKLSERVNMEVVYTPCELSRINVEIAEVNRPGLFLAGYYEYFDNLRLQIMGLAEMNFLSVQTPERRYEPSVRADAPGGDRLPQRRADPVPRDGGAGPEI